MSTTAARIPALLDRILLEVCDMAKEEGGFFPAPPNRRPLAGELSRQQGRAALPPSGASSLPFPSLPRSSFSSSASLVQAPREGEGRSAVRCDFGTPATFGSHLANPSFGRASFGGCQMASPEQGWPSRVKERALRPATGRPCGCAASAAPTRLPGSLWRSAGAFPLLPVLGSDGARRRERRSSKGRRGIRQAPSDEPVWLWKTQSASRPPPACPHPNPEMASVPIGRRALNSPVGFVCFFCFTKKK